MTSTPTTGTRRHDTQRQDTQAHGAGTRIACPCVRSWSLP